MFIAWSDADADWVEEIEIVSSSECEYVFNPLGVCREKQRAHFSTFPPRKENQTSVTKLLLLLQKKICNTYTYIFLFTL